MWPHLQKVHNWHSNKQKSYNFYYLYQICFLYYQNVRSYAGLLMEYCRQMQEMVKLWSWKMIKFYASNSQIQSQTSLTCEAF